MRAKTEIIITSVVLIVVMLLIFAIFQNTYFGKIKQITSLGYSEQTAKNIHSGDSELEKKILARNYSEIIDIFYTSEDFDPENLDFYYELTLSKAENYTNIAENSSIFSESYLKNANTLISINYASGDINLILAQNSQSLVDFLLEYHQNNAKNIEDIAEYLKIDIFKPENLARYLEYKQDKTYDQAILEVNINLDKTPYDDSETIEDLQNPLILVNKYHKLNQNYAPDDLEMVEKCAEKGENYQLSQATNAAYEKLCEKATEEGYSISVNSAYRSYEDQENTYNYYLKNRGVDYAEKYVARPGFSEHQTGMAIDIKSLKNPMFENSKEYLWLKEHAHEFGFIFRYQEKYQNYTGFNAESWHVRYVGEEVAKIIYENDLSFEEYSARFLDK